MTTRILLDEGFVSLFLFSQLSPLCLVNSYTSSKAPLLYIRFRGTLLLTQRHCWLCPLATMCPGETCPRCGALSPWASVPGTRALPSEDCFWLLGPSLCSSSGCSQPRRSIPVWGRPHLRLFSKCFYCTQSVAGSSLGPV